MNLEGLLKQYRIDADDTVAPYRAADDVVTQWLNDAIAEACIRGRLLHESSNPAVCQIAVTTGLAAYPLHPALYEIDHIAFKPVGAPWAEPVMLASRENLDRIRPGWRERTGRVEFAIQSDRTIRLALTPEADGILYLEGFRLPLVDIADGDDVPEINAAHHAKLVLWALHKGFSVPDSETIDPTRAALSERAFTAYFGLRPDSDLRRTTRHDEPQNNQAFWA